MSTRQSQPFVNEKKKCVKELNNKVGTNEEDIGIFSEKHHFF